MKIQVRSLVVLFGILFSAIFAHADRAGGGGNAVLCNGRPAEVLDFYNAKLKTVGGAVPELIDIENLDEQQTVDAVVNQFTLADGTFHVFKAWLRRALEKIGQIDDWSAADLKAANDSLEPYYLPTGCVRRTAAFRQDSGDVDSFGSNSFVMFGDPEIIGQLSPSQRGILRIHEAIYLLAYTNKKQTNSVAVRNLMKELLKRDRNERTLLRNIMAISDDWQFFPGVTEMKSGKYIVVKSNFKGESVPEKNWMQIEIDPNNHHVKTINHSSFKLPQVMELDCSDPADCKAVSGVPANISVSKQGEGFRKHFRITDQNQKDSQGYPQEWRVCYFDKTRTDLYFCLNGL